MGGLWLAIGVLGLGIVASFVAARRAVAAVGGETRRLHSRPSYYGADALVASLRLNHGVNGQPFEKPLDDLFSAVDAVQNYNPDALRSAAQKLRTVAQTLR